MHRVAGEGLGVMLTCTLQWVSALSDGRRLCEPGPLSHSVAAAGRLEKYFTPPAPCTPLRAPRSLRTANMNLRPGLALMGELPKQGRGEEKRITTLSPTNT
ncbi:hypothetical protein NDU88_002970 [Pleurodeles waltl]|uniref:Secreted protein n=1 Tax=Pleurodeles waltl TaxID=8319 RepID=A0AAV7UAU4_PLEWA|nr:hypothetical protein NDU88_002970 [Pleurodeles waltl]